MITCTFAGHREVYGSKIRDLVDETIESILKKDDTFLFYSGDMGDFDKLCASVVRAAKKRHPNLHITLVAVLPYMMNKVNTNKEYYEEYFDDVLIPAELSGVHYKSAISKHFLYVQFYLRPARTDGNHKSSRLGNTAYCGNAFCHICFCRCHIGIFNCIRQQLFY